MEKITRHVNSFSVLHFTQLFRRQRHSEPGDTGWLSKVYWFAILLPNVAPQSTIRTLRVFSIYFNAASIKNMDFAIYMQHVPTVVKPGPLYLVHSPENDVGLVGMTDAKGTYFGWKPECNGAVSECHAAVWGNGRGGMWECPI
jgi:hypothetical protein